MNAFQHNLHEQALQISKTFRNLETELIDILQKIDEAKVYLAMGYASLFEYATEALQLSESNAYTFTRISRKAKQIPELKIEIEKGNLSIANARQLIPIITPKNQSAWIQKATTLTKRELEAEVVKENPEAFKKESLRFVRENRMSLRVEISDALSQKLKRVQTLLNSQKRKNTSIEEALEEVIDLFLEKKDPIKKAQRNEKNVRVDGEGKGAPWKAPFPSPKAILPKLAPFFERHEKKELRTSLWQILTLNPPRSVGLRGPISKIRLPIPAEIRHQVFKRDLGRCSFRAPDGKQCHSQHFIQLHHRLPVSKGGTNSIENLITLCSSHHEYLHERVLENTLRPSETFVPRIRSVPS